MSKPDSKGVSLRTSLERVREFTGQTPPELADEKALPVLAMDWWEMWIEMDKGRQVTMNIQPISWVDMEAWARLSGRILTTLDVSALRAIDAAYVQVMSTKD